METTKLTDGVPLIQNGALTQKTIEQLAALVAPAVGKMLGVQNAEYSVSGQKWTRIARINSAPCLILVGNIYNNVLSIGAVISVSGAYGINYCEARLLSGNTLLFDKARFVCKTGETYFDVHSNCAADKNNTWYLTMMSTLKSKVGTTDLQPILYTVFTEGETPGGFGVKELTLDQLRGGGKPLVFRAYTSERRCAA